MSVFVFVSTCERFQQSKGAPPRDELEKPCSITLQVQDIHLSYLHHSVALEERLRISLRLTETWCPHVFQKPAMPQSLTSVVDVLHSIGRGHNENFLCPLPDH